MRKPFYPLLWPSSTIVHTNASSVLRRVPTPVNLQLVMLRRSFSKAIANKEPLLCDSSILSDDTDSSGDHGIGSVDCGLLPRKSLLPLLIAKNTKHPQKSHDRKAKPLPNAHDASDEEVRTRRSPSPNNYQKQHSSGENVAFVVDARSFPVLQSEELKALNDNFTCCNEWVPFGEDDGIASNSAIDAAVPSTQANTKESRSKSPKKSKTSRTVDDVKSLNESEVEPLAPTKAKTKAKVKVKSSASSGGVSSSPSKSRTKTKQRNTDGTVADSPSKKSKRNVAAINKKSRNEDAIAPTEVRSAGKESFSEGGLAESIAFSIPKSPSKETIKTRSHDSVPKANSPLDYLAGSDTPDPDSSKRASKSSKTEDTAHNSPQKGSETAKETKTDQTADVPDSPRKISKKSKKVDSDSGLPQKASRKSKATDFDNDPSASPAPDSPRKEKKKSKTKILDSPKKASRKSDAEAIAPDSVSPSIQSRKSKSEDTERDSPIKADKISKTLHAPKKTSRKSEIEETCPNPLSEKTHDSNASDSPLKADRELKQVKKFSESPRLSRKTTTANEIDISPIKNDNAEETNDASGSAKSNSVATWTAVTVGTPGSPNQAESKSIVTDCGKMINCPGFLSETIVILKTDESANVIDMMNNTVNASCCTACFSAPTLLDESGARKSLLKMPEASHSAESYSEETEATPKVSDVMGTMGTESDPVKGPTFEIALRPEILINDFVCLPKLGDDGIADENDVTTVNQSPRKQDGPTEARSDPLGIDKSLSVSVEDDPRTPSTGDRNRWIKRQSKKARSNESSESDASNGSSVHTFEEEHLMEAVWLDITLGDDDDDGKHGPIKEVKNFFARPFNKPTSRDSSSDDSSSDSDSEHPVKFASRLRESATGKNKETDAPIVTVATEGPAEVEELMEMAETTMSEGPVPNTETLVSVQSAPENAVASAPAKRLSLDDTDSESSDDGPPLALNCRPGGGVCSNYNEQRTAIAKRQPPPGRAASKSLENVISLKDRMKFLKGTKLGAESDDPQDLPTKTVNEAVSNPRVAELTNPRFHGLKRLAQNVANEITREEENGDALGLSQGKPQQSVSLFSSPPQNDRLACSSYQPCKPTTPGPSNGDNTSETANSELTKVPVPYSGSSKSAVVAKPLRGGAVNSRFQELKSLAMKTANETVSGDAHEEIGTASRPQEGISTLTNPFVKTGLARKNDNNNPGEFKIPSARASTAVTPSNSRFQELKRLAMKNAHEISSDDDNKDSQRPSTIAARRQLPVSSTFQQLREQAMRISHQGGSKTQSPQHSPSHSSNNSVSSKRKEATCFTGPRRHSVCSFQNAPPENTSASTTCIVPAPSTTNFAKAFYKTAVGRLRDGEDGSESSSAVQQQYRRFSEKLGGSCHTSTHSRPKKQSLTEEDSQSNSTSGIIRETTQVEEFESPQRRLTLDSDTDSEDDDFHNDFRASTQFSEMRAQARLRSPAPGRHPSQSLNHVLSIKDRQKLFQSK